MPSVWDDVRREAKNLGKNIDDVSDDVIETIIKHPGALALGPLAPAWALGKSRGMFDAFKGIPGWGALGGGGKRTPRNPGKAKDPDAPQPGDYSILTESGGKTVCSMLPGGGQPFPLIGYSLMAAGAKTQGTDLFDFHAAASNPTVITSNDLIPGNVEVFEASLYVGVKMLTTAGSENTALLNQFWLIERVNGIEKARWSLKQLGEMVSHTGVLTNGACASTVAIDLPSIPWHRKYDPNVPHALVVQIGVTTTLIQAIEWCLVETGKRP